MKSKAQLIKEIAERTGVSQADAGRVIDALSDFAIDDLLDSGEANLPGIGKLKLSRRQAREGRNPRTGETVTIEARNSIKLSVSKPMKLAVQ